MRSTTINIADNSETDAIGAQGAGVPIRVHRIYANNAHATTTQVWLLDGAGGAVVFRAHLTEGGTANVDYGPDGAPLTANTALRIDTDQATTDVDVIIQWE